MGSDSQLAETLNGFSILLFVPPASEVLAELKRTIYTAFFPLIIQSQPKHNALENKVYYGLATTLYYFSNKERKRIERPEVIGVAMGGGEQVSLIWNATNDKKNDDKACCLINFSFF